MTEVAPEKLAEAFNAFAAKAQQDHPQLKGGLLVLDLDSGSVFGELDRKKRYSYVSDDLLKKSLVNVAKEVEKKGSQAFQMTGLLQGKLVDAGKVIGYQKKDWISDLIDDPYAKIDDRIFTLYHELGHLVVPNGFSNYDNAGLKNRAESSADIYALIRLSQLYPDEMPQFIQKLELYRAMAAVEKGDTEHYSVPSIKVFKELRKQQDISKLSPDDAVTLAAAIASENFSPSTSLKEIDLAFANFRDTAVKEGLQQGLRSFAENALAAEPPVFNAAMSYLRPFLDREVERKSFDFSGEYWVEMREKLKARETAPEKAPQPAPKAA